MIRRYVEEREVTDGVGAGVTEGLKGGGVTFCGRVVGVEAEKNCIKVV
jgi:hypothetical protein